MGNLHRLVVAGDRKNDKRLVGLTVGFCAVSGSAVVDRRVSTRRRTRRANFLRTAAGSHRSEVVAAAQRAVLHCFISHPSLHPRHHIDLYREVPSRIRIGRRYGDIADVHR